MISRRDRKFPSHKTEPTPFAARATDLGALRDAVVDAAGVGTGLWLSYLFVLFYFAIAAGAVTHRDLLLENPVKLPFLNVELPLKAFYVLGPLVFLIVHAYVLLHFVLFAGKIGAFHSELQDQIAVDERRAQLRRQLPSNIFVQSLAGPRDVREGPIGFLLRLVIRISLVAGPIALLILFQLQFLPYHEEWITNWQRLAVVTDFVLLWFLWPPIARGEATLLTVSDFRRSKVQAWLVASFLPVLLVFTIATFPGEWLDDNLPPLRLIPTTWAAWTLPSVEAIQAPGSGWATLHELLVAGEVNYVTGRPQSLWSNVLVLPNFEVRDRVLSLRGRSLEGAVLVGAHLRNADFTGAFLKGAKFTLADLREAKFGFNYLRGDTPGFFPTGGCNEDIGCAQLQGADFNFAQLQGALFDRAQLQGAMFINAQLQGADLLGAQLQGTWLDGMQLQGAEFMDTQLQGASLNDAQLQGADLARADPQFPGLHDARLDGAELRNTYLWRTHPPSNPNGAFVSGPELRPKYLWLDCPAGECDWVRNILRVVDIADREIGAYRGQRDQALRQIAILGKPPFVAHEASVKAWTDLAKESARSADSYFNTLAEKLKEIGCAADGAPYVIGALMRQVSQNETLLAYRFQSWRHPSQEAEVAGAFIDDAKCPGARGLSEDNKAKLREIRDRASAPTGPAAAAR